jgi:predicted MFS family arabinose efflux permease
MPFYVLYAASHFELTGSNLALLTIAFTIAGTISNHVWGWTADRFGFRLVLLASLSLWVFASIGLLVSATLASAVAVFASIGAAAQGFQNACVNLTLEFGTLPDLPLRIAIANSASELTGTIGLLVGGALAAGLGYEAVIITSIVCLVAGGGMVWSSVPDPRRQAT